MSDRFTVRITAGGIVECDGKILVVTQRLDEEPDGPIYISQPVGHLEDGESMMQTAERELFEETGYRAEATQLIGLYQRRTSEGWTYVRASFLFRLVTKKPEPVNDQDTIEVLWLTKEELLARKSEWKPGATTPTFEDYFAGKRYPIDLLHFQVEKNS